MSIWVVSVSSTGGTVGLAGVKPNFFETGLTPWLSCAQSVRVAHIWPPQSRSLNRKLRSVCGQLKPESLLSSPNVLSETWPLLVLKMLTQT